MFVTRASDARTATIVITAVVTDSAAIKRWEVEWRVMTVE